MFEVMAHILSYFGRLGYDYKLDGVKTFDI